MSGAVMAASPREGAGRSGSLPAAGPRVRAMCGLGEISPVCVSEGDTHLRYMIDIALTTGFSLTASGAVSGGDRAILAGVPGLSLIKLRRGK
jgi:hypothetical protein